MLDNMEEKPNIVKLWKIGRVTDILRAFSEPRRFCDVSKIFVSGDDPMYYMYVIILAELGMIEHSADARDGFQLTRAGRQALARLETSKNG
jgi:hypothetical protein